MYACNHFRSLAVRLEPGVPGDAAEPAKGVSMGPRVDLIYIDSGGGHRAAANALSEVIRGRQPDWDLRMVSMQDLLSSIDVVRKTTGIPFQDIYNIMLRHGWTAVAGQVTPLAHLIIRLRHAAEVRVLESYWRERRPDLVVSLIPHFNRALKESLERARPEAPFVTILTDIADYPPHFWLEPQDQYVICGSERAVEQAREVGIPEDKVLRASGMIVHPRFYRQINPDRAAERVRLGLRPDVPTGLVLFGGEGSPEMVEIAERLNRPDSGVQLILLCGRNEEVRQELLALPRQIPMIVEGFTKEVPFYMELADFFIGKPGPGSISEAVAKRLPVIVRKDWRTMAHERYNCNWVEEQEIGMVVPSYDGLYDAVRDLLEPERYARVREKLEAIENRAVFEVPEMLEGILHRRTEGVNPQPAEDCRVS
jgi:Glycosyltransferase family 28 C-terminal domain/Monogalactosyldiacylglycerol (MGDG) synthase